MRHAPHDRGSRGLLSDREFIDVKPGGGLWIDGQPAGQPGGNFGSASSAAGSGDPCKIVSIATLEQATGLTGLAVQQQLGKSTNGCHWGSGAYGVAYDVLPMVGSESQMITQIQAGMSGSGGHATATKVSLGNGHDGLQLVVNGAPTSTVDLFLPDRYAAIVVVLAPGTDAGAAALNVAKALSAASANLPPAAT